jgi:ribonucleoside-diphosphate reductase beta chain
MSLTSKRAYYKPFEYPEFHEYMIQQNNVHWVPSEVKMSQDVEDWQSKLTDAERSLVGNILKGFTQMEVSVADYWSTKVARWFPKPEIASMALAFGAFEGIHQWGYSYLNDSLGLQDYKAFLDDPATKAKIDALIDAPGKTLEEKARSLAVFSAFGEGVQLFSSFAILMSFSTRNMLKGVGNIVRWSVRDESLHSKAGCHLFRKMMEENPDIWSQKDKDGDEVFKKSIYQAARDSVDLEDKFIDKAFEAGPIQVRLQDGSYAELTAYKMKQFIRHRANTKLGDLGLKINWTGVKKDIIKEMSWFDDLIGAEEHTDFFAQRQTDYSKGTKNWGKVWE